MGIYTDQDTVEYVRAIDTDLYAGNFEREMFAFIFGLPDTPGEHTSSSGLAYEQKARAGGLSMKVSDRFAEDLLDVRVNDPGDDGLHRAYVTIAPTPGWFNDGRGTHLEDTEENRAKYAARYPAFQSVAVFLQRPPTPEEAAIIKDRAAQFSTLPKVHDWDSRPKVIGIRVLCCTSKWTTEVL
jgi:hypothetical protein